MIPANEATRIADHVAENTKAKKVALVGKWMKEKEIEKRVTLAANAGRYSVTIYRDDCPDTEMFKQIMRALGYKIDIDYGNKMDISWSSSNIKSDFVNTATSYNTTIKKEGSTYDYLG